MRVGDAVIRNGQRYRVTKFNPNTESVIDRSVKAYERKGKSHMNWTRRYAEQKEQNRFLQNRVRELELQKSFTPGVVESLKEQLDNALEEKRSAVTDKCEAESKMSEMAGRLEYFEGKAKAGALVKSEDAIIMDQAHELEMKRFDVDKALELAEVRYKFKLIAWTVGASVTCGGFGTAMGIFLMKWIGG